MLHLKSMPFVFLGCVAFGFALLMAIPAANATGTGLDCIKAASDIEKYVCSNSPLDALDGVLNEVYAARKGEAKGDGRIALQDSEKAWLLERNGCMDNLPADRYFCMLKAYTDRIRLLGGTEQLVEYYKQACVGDEWSCEAVGDLALERGNLKEAVHFYGILCAADYDGDAGRNCYKKASVLEKLNLVSEAKTIYVSACKNRNNNEACAAAMRLGPKKDSSDQWIGLYRSSNGTLFIDRDSNDGYKINMDTTWDNGHICSYTGIFTLKNGKPSITVNNEYAECIPVITKQGVILSIKDPSGNCKTVMCGLRGHFEDEFKKEELSVVTE